MQAEGNYPREGYEESAGMMYRRAIELGLSEKYPNLKGTLAAKISQLVNEPRPNQRPWRLGRRG